jgi:hypothetical protein
MRVCYDSRTDKSNVNGYGFAFGLSANLTSKALRDKYDDTCQTGASTLTLNV